MKYLLILLMTFFIGCASTQRYDTGAVYDDTITIQIHPNNWDAKYVKVYCDGLRLTTIRNLVFNRAETRTIRNASHCEYLSFNINDKWNSSPLMFSRGIVNLVISPGNMNTSYMYIR